MPVSVTLQTVHPRKFAAVRREVAPGAVGPAWRPALDKVWSGQMTAQAAMDSIATQAQAQVQGRRDVK